MVGDVNLFVTDADEPHKAELEVLTLMSRVLGLLQSCLVLDLFCSWLALVLPLPWPCILQ